MTRPVNSSSFAYAGADDAGQLRPADDEAVGRTGKRNAASSDAIRMSHVMASSAPPP